MAFNFPSSPSVGDVFPATGTPLYRWNGAIWAIISGSTTIAVSDAPPTGPQDNTLWYETDTGRLNLRLNDGDSTQWIQAAASTAEVNASLYVQRAGDNMSGALVLPGNPTTALQAAPKQYIDSSVATSIKRNRILNGAMMVSQENGATVGSSLGYFPADLFSSDGTGSGAAVISAAQVASATPAGSPNRIRFTVTTAQSSIAAGDLRYIRQAIEGFRVADLRSGTANAKTIVLQFGVKAPAGTYSVSFRNAATNRSYIAEYVIAAGEANTDVVKQVSFQMDTVGVWTTDNSSGIHIGWVLLCGATYAGAPGAWSAGNLIGSTNQFNFAGQVNNVFELFDVSLTEGSIAAPFQVPDYISELALCYRYWEKIGMTLDVESNTYGNTSWYKATKRAAPTITLIAGSLNGGVVAPLTYSPLDGLRQVTNPSGAVDAQWSINARL
jgi:hypothetical protein